MSVPIRICTYIHEPSLRARPAGRLLPEFVFHLTNKCNAGQIFLLHTMSVLSTMARVEIVKFKAINYNNVSLRLVIIYQITSCTVL